MWTLHVESPRGQSMQPLTLDTPRGQPTCPLHVGIARGHSMQTPHMDPRLDMPCHLITNKLHPASGRPPRPPPRSALRPQTQLPLAGPYQQRWGTAAADSGPAAILQTSSAAAPAGAPHSLPLVVHMDNAPWLPAGHQQLPAHVGRQPADSPCNGLPTWAADVPSLKRITHVGHELTTQQICKKLQHAQSPARNLQMWAINNPNCIRCAVLLATLAQKARWTGHAGSLAMWANQAMWATRPRGARGHVGCQATWATGPHGPPSHVCHQATWVTKPCGPPDHVGRGRRWLALYATWPTRQGRPGVQTISSTTAQRLI